MIVLTSGERAWLRHGRQLRIAHLVWRKQVHRLLAQVVNEVGLHTLVPTSTRVDRIMRLCTDAECPWCSQIICPYDDLMHFHHDGCPACADAPGEPL